MRSRFALAGLATLAGLTAAAALAGCTYHRRIQDVHEVAGKVVTVETYDGASIDVRAEPAFDGLTFRTYDGRVVLAGEVARVVDRRRGRGALEGFGVGAAIGIVGGVAAGIASGDDVCEHEGHCLLTFSAADKAFLGAIFFGALGGGVGAVVGAVRGSHFVYSFGEQTRVIPTGPPGSVGGMTIVF